MNRRKLSSILFAFLFSMAIWAKSAQAQSTGADHIKYHLTETLKSCGLGANTLRKIGDPLSGLSINAFQSYDSDILASKPLLIKDNAHRTLTRIFLPDEKLGTAPTAPERFIDLTGLLLLKAARDSRVKPNPNLLRNDFECSSLLQAKLNADINLFSISELRTLITGRDDQKARISIYVGEIISPLYYLLTSGQPADRVFVRLKIWEHYQAHPGLAAKKLRYIAKFKGAAIYRGFERLFSASGSASGSLNVNLPFINSAMDATLGGSTENRLSFSVSRSLVFTSDMKDLPTPQEISNAVRADFKYRVERVQGFLILDKDPVQHLVTAEGIPEGLCNGNWRGESEASNEFTIASVTSTAKVEHDVEHCVFSVDIKTLPSFFKNRDDSTFTMKYRIISSTKVEGIEISFPISTEVGRTKDMRLVPLHYDPSGSLYREDSGATLVKWSIPISIEEKTRWTGQPPTYQVASSTCDIPTDDAARKATVGSAGDFLVELEQRYNQNLEVTRGGIDCKITIHVHMPIRAGSGVTNVERVQTIGLSMPTKRDRPPVSPQ